MTLYVLRVGRDSGSTNDEGDLTGDTSGRADSFDAAVGKGNELLHYERFEGEDGKFGDWWVVHRGGGGRKIAASDHERQRNLGSKC